jgi:hypothetical protein
MAGAGEHEAQLFTDAALAAELRERGRPER